MVSYLAPYSSPAAFTIKGIKIEYLVGVEVGRGWVCVGVGEGVTALAGPNWGWVMGDVAGMFVVVESGDKVKSSESDSGIGCIRSADIAIPGAIKIITIITPNNPNIAFLKRLMFTIRKYPEASSNHLPMTAIHTRISPITTHAKQMSAIIDSGSSWCDDCMLGAVPLPQAVSAIGARTKNKRLNTSKPPWLRFIW